MFGALAPARAVASGPHERHLRPVRANDTDPPLRFMILGPTVALSGDRNLTPRAHKVRTLLAALLVHHNSVASVDVLIRELWGDEPPRTAVQALRVYVSQLRQILDSDGAPTLLTTQPYGYRLRICDTTLDLLEWDQQCARGRQAQAACELERASDHYGRALSLWRGRPLLDVRSGPVLAGVATSLEEAWIATVVRRVDVDLALGRHSDVVSELRALVAQHQFNEGLHARLMIALYRSGRTNDALAVYRDVRRALVDELGVEPNRRLQLVHQAVLASDHRWLDQSQIWAE